MGVHMWWCRLFVLTIIAGAFLISSAFLGLHANLKPLLFERLVRSSPEEATTTLLLQQTNSVITQPNTAEVITQQDILPPENEIKKRKENVTRPSFKLKVDMVEGKTRKRRKKLKSHKVKKLKKKAKTDSSKVLLVKENTTPSNTVTKKDIMTEKPVSKAPALLWLGKEGKKFADYGDKGCGDHPERRVFEDLMKIWIAMAAKYNITYFLTCGTLLGAYRNGDVIPNDGDLDILVDVGDYPKIKRLSRQRDFVGNEEEAHLVTQVDFEKPLDTRRRFSCQGKLTPVYMDHCSFQEPMARIVKGNCHLDLYHFIMKENTIDDPSEGGRIYKKPDIFPLRRCMFMNIEMRCPNNPKSLLTMLYGEDLRPHKICRQGEWIKNS